LRFPACISRPTSRRAALATRRYDWRTATPSFLAKRFSHSIARISSWLSVGCAMAFVCAVVSTVTRRIC